MDTKTLSNKQLLDFHQGLESVRHLRGAKFGYAVSRNFRSIDPQVRSLQDASAYSPDYQEYIRFREEAGLPFAVKTEDGNPLYDLYNGELFMKILPEKENEFREILASLQKKFTKAIRQHKAQQSEYQDLLKQKVSVEVFSIDQELLPEGIRLGQAFRILPMILEKSRLPLIPCKFKNSQLLNFPSEILRYFSGVEDLEFILAMLENFRILYIRFLHLQDEPVIRDYREIYEKSRVEICEKYARQNCYGNPLMGDSAGVLEYVIEETPDYKKAMKIFSGSMKDVVSRYNGCLKGMGEIHLSGITFEQIPGDFSVQQVDILADMIRG